MWASYKGHANVVIELLLRGAQPNVQAHVSQPCTESLMPSVVSDSPLKFVFFIVVFQTTEELN